MYFESLGIYCNFFATKIISDDAGIIIVLKTDA